jgi:hypothetical protein
MDDTQIEKYKKQHAYYLKNIEHIKEKNLKYYHQNKPDRSEYNKKYYEERKYYIKLEKEEKKLRYFREYVKKNKDSIDELKKTYTRKETKPKPKPKIKQGDVNNIIINFE